MEREEKTAVIKNDGGRLGSTIARLWSPIILPGEREVNVRIERVQREQSWTTLGIKSEEFFFFFLIKTMHTWKLLRPPNLMRHNLRKSTNGQTSLVI